MPLGILSDEEFEKELESLNNKVAYDKVIDDLVEVKPDKLVIETLSLSIETLSLSITNLLFSMTNLSGLTSTKSSITLSYATLLLSDSNSFSNSSSDKIPKGIIKS